jgi:hypothetical protein
MVPAGCEDFWAAFFRLLFDSHDSLERCTNDQGVYAFAVLAALAFGAFVVIDQIVALVKRFGFAATGAGNLGITLAGSPFWIAIKLLGIVAFGMVAAGIVAFFAAIVDFLQLAPQTAVAAGVLWQVIYAELLERLGERGQPDSRPPSSQGAQLPEPEVIQEPTEEVAE